MKLQGRKKCAQGLVIHSCCFNQLTVRHEAVRAAQCLIHVHVIVGVAAINLRRQGSMCMMA